MNIDFNNFNVPAQTAVIRKLQEIGVVITTNPTVFDIIMFLYQTYGLVVNVIIDDITDSIDNPYHYDMHYMDRNGMHSLKSFEDPENTNGFTTYINAYTVGMINIINTAQTLNLIKI